MALEVPVGYLFSTIAGIETMESLSKQRLRALPARSEARKAPARALCQGRKSAPSATASVHRWPSAGSSPQPVVPGGCSAADLHCDRAGVAMDSAAALSTAFRGGDELPLCRAGARLDHLAQCGLPIRAWGPELFYGGRGGASVWVLHAGITSRWFDRERFRLRRYAAFILQALRER